MASRFYAETLHRESVVFFIDPPYTAGGKRAGLRLYRHAVMDHEAIFDAARSIEGDFLMTYDDAEEVETMARARGFDLAHVPMKKYSPRRDERTHGGARPKLDPWTDLGRWLPGPGERRLTFPVVRLGILSASGPAGS